MNEQARKVKEAMEHLQQTIKEEYGLFARVNVYIHPHYSQNASINDPSGMGAHFVIAGFGADYQTHEDEDINFVVWEAKDPEDEDKDLGREIVIFYPTHQEEEVQE